MTPDLNFRRRTLLVFYRRYLNADRALRLAQREALSWFPLEARPSVPPIGDPGSRVRRLYDRRDRALAQFGVVYEEFNEVQRRSTRRIHILALPPH